MFSVVILTLNAEATLPGCLASVRGCDDILVLDSGSTDRTPEIARSHGVRWLTHPFESFSLQRTFADRHGGCRHPWAFHLDADEEFTPELFSECLNWGDPGHLDGARAAPRMMYGKKWIRFSTDYPVPQARLVHRGRFRWIQAGHGQQESPDMRMGRLRSDYVHHFMAHGEGDWLRKHRTYARLEAEQHLSTPAGGVMEGLFSGDRIRRRRALKRLSYHLPFRPSLRLLYQYVLRGGFLDGAHGWRYCRLLARYEAFASEALREMKSLRLKSERIGSLKQPLQ
ncbi:MAG: glycosyltransferase family 2 protein [Opitutaceae bacterium]|nr:glycosyltransferase family 2 protein [Opitutaceae bacterium]